MLTLNDVQNINEALESAAKSLNVAQDSLDLRLLGFSTFVKKKDAEFFETLTPENLATIDSDEVFESPNYELKQTYNIEIFPHPRDEFYNVRVVGDYAGFELVLYKHFAPPKNPAEWEKFFEKITAMKVRLGIFLRKISEEKEAIKRAIEGLELKDGGLKKDAKIALYTSKTFKSPKDSRLEFMLENIDLTKKNVICARENTTICRYYPPKDGAAGRDVRGIFSEAKSSESTAPSATQDFSTSNEGDFVSYENLKSGFVIYDAGAFSFEQELNFMNLNAKDNYHFSGDLEAETSLILGSDGEFDDALKNGVSVMAKKLTVNGNIGANTRVRALELVITGQTHKDSKISAKKADISVHRGDLEAESAVIKSIESGRVLCDELEIGRVNGGDLSAARVNIGEIYSNTSVAFSQKCVIEMMRGGGNKINFTPLGGRKMSQKLGALMKKIEENASRAHKIEEDSQVLLKKYNKYQATAKQLKSTIDTLRKQGDKIPEYVVKNYQAFMEIVEKIKALKAQNAALEAQNANLAEEVKSLEQDIFSAEFICKDGWLKYNDVALELLLPKKSIAKTIIKGVGRYFFDQKEKRITHQRIFAQGVEESIKNQGF